jgi:hypothetical protein
MGKARGIALEASQAARDRKFVDWKVALRAMMVQIHETAVEKGFWEQGKDHNISEALMLIVTEVAEACEALRAGPTADKHVPIFDNFTVELADATIRIFDLSVGMGLTHFPDALLAKMEYNAGREYRHGKNF